MQIKVERVRIAAGSSVGLGAGRPVGDPTKVVYFAGDAEPMYAIGMAIEEANQLGGEPPEADVPDWAILAILELPNEL